MFVGGSHPVDGYDNQHEGTPPENAPSVARDLAISNMTTTAPPFFALTSNTGGAPHNPVQDAISFNLRLESAVQRLGTGSVFEAVGANGETTIITNEQLERWRTQQALKLIGHVVDQILDFLTMFSVDSLLEFIALDPQAEVLPIPFSFLTTLHSIRKTYQLSDPDWWPFLRPQDMIVGADSTLMAKHNLAVATLCLLRPGNKLPDLHEEFLNIYVVPDERLDIWHADLYFAIKITVVISSWPLSELLFGCGFPEPASRVLKRRNQNYDALPDNMSDGERLLYTRCAYVRVQYDSGVLSVEELEKFRGGRTWYQSVQRALPHIINLVRRVQQDPTLVQTDSLSLQGQFARPDSHVVPTKGRIALSQDDLPGTTAILAEAIGLAVCRMDQQRSETPSSEPVERSTTYDISIPPDEPRPAMLEPTPTIEVADMTSQPVHTRRPWTSDEEAALLAGLATVAGPHWSQILALYGTTGSTSNVLRDRSQVQLKDKARNLKLAYLKAGKEVPSELRGVTGSLGKRKRPKQGDGRTAEDEDMDVGM